MMNNKVEVRNVINRDIINRIIVKLETIRNESVPVTEKTVVYYHYKNDVHLNEPRKLFEFEGDKSKYFDAIELTIVTMLNDKPFFSLNTMKKSVAERIVSLEKKDKEYDDKFGNKTCYENNGKQMTICYQNQIMFF